MSTKANDPNFFRNDTPVFGSLRLTDANAQLQTPSADFTLPTASGTFRTSGSSQPVNSPTFSATVSVDSTVADVVKVAGVYATSAVCTINLAASPAEGQVMYFILTADGAETYTFGTHMLPTATVVLTDSDDFAVVAFLSDGTNAIELCRNLVTTGD